MRHVGKGYEKVDAMPILTGEPVYTEDLIPPHALCIKVLRSPHAFARIRSIKTDAAKKVPGVEAIFTYEDTPQIRFTLAGQTYPEPSAYDKMLLDPVVRYVGDEVAFVVAKDERTANKALRLIRVDYEVMEPVLDYETAKDHPSIVHDEDNIHFNFPVGQDVKRNVACSYHVEKGDLEGTLANCAYVAEGTYRCQATQQSMMEPFKTFCHLDYMGRLVCVSSTQIPFHVRRHISKLLQIPSNKVRVIKPRIGGGFGAKQTACTELICAFVTWTLKKPAYLIYERHEAANCSTSRHARTWKVRVGADKDGMIRAIDMLCVSDAGAYGSHAWTTFTAAEHKSIPMYNKTYAIRYSGEMMYTNHMPGGAFRGYGATEADYALESAVNKLAAMMGMDETEIRLKNIIKAGETSLVYPEGEVLGSSSLDECIRKGMEMIGWNERPHSWQVDEHTRGGLGIGMGMQGSGIAGIDTASVEIRLGDDGLYTLYTGATDMGTGSNTILKQMAAEVLGCSMEQMTVYEADTDVVPFDPGSYASSTTYVTGMAAKKAAESLLEIILAHMAAELQCTAEELDFDGWTAVSRVSGESLDLKELQVRLTSRPDCMQLSAAASHGSPVSPPPFIVGFAEVHVDTETGRVTPVDFVGVVDCGTVVNPHLVRVQTEGGIAQGIGMALYEEIRYNAHGALETNNFMLYKVPTRKDVGVIRTSYVESYEPTGPYGVKSIGEVVINSSCPAIQNAIDHAVGVHLDVLPFIPERVYMAMKKKDSEK